MENVIETVTNNEEYTLQTQIIGCGACGGKVIKDLIDYNIMPINKCLIINSTDQDRPETPAAFINIGRAGDVGGCAKNPNEGIKLCQEAMMSGKLDIEKFLLPDTKKVYIITSLEGGTGCGSSQLIIQYLSEVTDIPVHVIAVSGFEDDARGLKNSVKFMQNLTENLTVSIICNKKYLKMANGDKLKAEKLCNLDIINIISILDGNIIVPSDKNIDSKDLLKLSTMPGYINVCSMDIDDKIRNVDQFNSILKEMIDNSKSMDVRSPKQAAMGVFINIPPEEQMNIDYTFSVIKEHYNTDDSENYDTFTHIQYNPDMVRSISFVNAGMQLPLDEMRRMYDLHNIINEKAKAAEKDKAKFFNAAQEMIFDDDDEDEDAKKNTISKNDFFMKLGGGNKPKAKPAPVNKLDQF